MKYWEVGQAYWHWGSIVVLDLDGTVRTSAAVSATSKYLDDGTVIVGKGKNKQKFRWYVNVLGRGYNDKLSFLVNPSTLHDIGALHRALERVGVWCKAKAKKREATTARFLEAWGNETAYLPPKNGYGRTLSSYIDSGEFQGLSQGVYKEEELFGHTPIEGIVGMNRLLDPRLPIAVAANAARDEEGEAWQKMAVLRGILHKSVSYALTKAGRPVSRNAAVTINGVRTIWECPSAPHTNTAVGWLDGSTSGSDWKLLAVEDEGSWTSLEFNDMRRDRCLGRSMG